MLKQCGEGCKITWQHSTGWKSLLRGLNVLDTYQRCPKSSQGGSDHHSGELLSRLRSVDENKWKKNVVALAVFELSPRRRKLLVRTNTKFRTKRGLRRSRRLTTARCKTDSFTRKSDWSNLEFFRTCNNRPISEWRNSEFHAQTHGSSRQVACCYAVIGTSWHLDNGAPTDLQLNEMSAGRT